MEQWKKISEIPQYEIYKDYSVSNTGLVRNDKTGKVLKNNADIDGYFEVTLYDVGHHGVNKKVHRLVALAFIPNFDEKHYTQVNHKDENKQNNKVDNLEWCTVAYNINYGSRTKRASEKQSKTMSERYKGSSNPFYGRHHTEASKKKMSESQKGRKTSIESRRKLSIALTGRKFSEEHKKKLSIGKVGEGNPMYGRSGKNSPTSIPRVQLTLDGKYIKSFGNSSETALDGFNPQCVIDCCNGKQKTHKGYKWMNLKDYENLVKESGDD